MFIENSNFIFIVFKVGRVFSAEQSLTRQCYLPRRSLMARHFIENIRENSLTSRTIFFVVIVTSFYLY